MWYILIFTYRGVALLLIMSIRCHRPSSITLYRYIHCRLCTKMNGRREHTSEIKMFLPKKLNSFQPNSRPRIEYHNLKCMKTKKKKIKKSFGRSFRQSQWHSINHGSNGRQRIFNPLKKL